MPKKILLSLTLLLLASNLSLAEVQSTAKEPANNINPAPAVTEPAIADITQTLLVYDVVLRDGKLRNYRNVEDCVRNAEEFSGTNLTGLTDLRMSGSAQFSKQELPYILKHAKGEVFIVDLRQEPHGFINDKAFTLFSYRNQINANKTGATIQLEENNLLAELALHKKLTLHKVKKIGDGYFESVQDFIVRVENVYSERELLEQFSIGYKRLYVQDRHKPRDSQVDAFLEFVRSLPKGAWLHFHCRAGKGRTTTFMVMYDIIRNGKNVSLADILARQLELGGSVLDGAILKNQNSQWAVPALKNRYKFISEFYNYVLAKDGYGSQKWSVWSNKSND